MIRSDDLGRPVPHEPEPVDPKLFRKLLDRQRRRESGELGEEAREAGRSRGVTLTKRRLLPMGSKQEVVSRIRESFQDLTDVLGAIDRKIEAHNRTSEKLENSVRNLPELMEGLPAASEAGIQLMEDLRATVGTQTALTKDVVSSVEALALRVAQIPDALAKFDERMHRQEADQRRTVDALATLQTTVAQMHAESAQLQQKAYEQLAATLQADREETRRAIDADRRVLSEVVERGNRQSMILTVVLIVVVAALAVALLLK